MSAERDGVAKLPGAAGPPGLPAMPRRVVAWPEHLNDVNLLLSKIDALAAGEHGQDIHQLVVEIRASVTCLACALLTEIIRAEQATHCGK